MAATDVRQQAARRALARQLRQASQGRSMLHPFIGRSLRFTCWQHYPRHDAMDVSGNWQFYFHAHDPAEADDARHADEHGHIHLFRRDALGRLSHLTGLSLSARGVPLAWFATNQWVTGERWMAAGSLARGLSDIELRLRGPLSGAALWLADLVRLYAEPLCAMLRARDVAVLHYAAQHHMTSQAARADRRVTVWSSLPIHWPQDALQLCGQNSPQPSSRSST